MCLNDATGAEAETAPSPTGLVILPWRCPSCTGTGRWPEGERCHLCLGRGAVTAETAQLRQDGDPDPALLIPAPTPPAVMRSPCGDCAFRPGSPEAVAGQLPPLDRPFHCHHGLRILRGAYAPIAWVDGVPLGAMVCRGWWAAVTGRLLPAEAYRPARDGWGDPAGPTSTPAGPPAATLAALLTIWEGRRATHERLRATSDDVSARLASIYADLYARIIIELRRALEDPRGR